MQLVILAGGKGTRLGLTDIPKPMVMIAGKPQLEHQIELAKKYGVTEVFLLCGHLAHVIQDYFGDGSKWGMKIHTVIEPEPLGTAGALHLIKDKLQERFLMFYGDVVMDFDIGSFQKFDAEADCIATLLVHPNNHPYDSDLIEVDKHNNVLSFLSKPHPEGLIYRNLVNAAVYILSRKIVDYIEEGKPSDFGKEVFPRVLSAGEKIRAYVSAEYIKDMGTKDRFPLICEDVATGRVTRLNKQNARPAIFLDRDGVINKDMDKNPTVEHFELLPNVAEAITKINNSDFLSIVVTNQPMIAKGFIGFDDVENVHKMLETQLGEKRAHLDAIYYCPHHPEKGFAGEVPELKIQCHCRKPDIGMFEQAKEEFNIDLKNSWMIGDRESDMLAGKKAGCHTILVGDTIPSSPNADFQCADLNAAVDLIMEKNK